MDRANENLERTARLFKIIKEFGNEFYMEARSTLDGLHVYTEMGITKRTVQFLWTPNQQLA